MTVSSNTNEVRFVGNGASVFDLPFRFFLNADIQAMRIDTVTGLPTPQVEGVDYTLTGAGDPEINGSATGKLTLLVPLALGTDLLVERMMEIEQPIDLVNQGEFFAETHEEGFDRVTMLIQQNASGIRGAIQVAVADPEPNRLPPAASRALMLMGFDAGGNPIPVAPSNGSAADLALDLRNPTDLSKGATMVGAVARIIQNIAELRTFTGSYDGQTARTLGHTVAGQGEGLFRWSPVSAETDNNGTIIQPIGSATGRWIMMTNGRVDVSQFGAVHGADCLAALQAAAAWCTLPAFDTLTGAGEYTMSGGVANLRRVALEAENMRITTTSAAARIILGNVSTSAYGPRQSIGQLWKNNELITTDPTIQIVGAKGQVIDIGFTNKIQVYADIDLAADTSTAYCTFNINYAYRVELRTNMAHPDGTIQWINENTFNIKRAVEISVSGTYHHNHNIFNTGTLEGTSLIFLSKGSSNLFMCERFENGPATLNFAVGTWANFVYATWNSNNRQAYEATTNLFTVADNGTGNMVVRLSDVNMRHNEVLAINTRTCQSFTRVTKNVTTLVGAYPSASGQDDFEITVNSQIVGDTGKIPVRVNDGFQAILDTNKFRCRWMLYDVNGKEMTGLPADASLLLRDGNTNTISGNFYTQNAGVAESVAVVTGATVGYLRCQIYGNGATGTGQRFKGVSVHALTQHLFKDGGQRMNRQASQMAAAAAMPTVGYAEAGTRVGSTTAAGTQWLATFDESTFLSAGAAGGATTITVTGAGVKAIGDRVGVQLDTGATHWTTLTAIAPLTLTAPLPSAAAAGNPTCFVRWV